MALVGHNGIRKKSIMNVLFQFFNEFEKGKLTIDGHDVKEMRNKATRDIWELYARSVFQFSGASKH